MFTWSNGHTEHVDLTIESFVKFIQKQTLVRLGDFLAHILIIMQVMEDLLVHFCLCSA